jgi:hypothetical protein
MIKKLNLKFFLVAAVPALLALHGCKNKSEAALEVNEQQTPAGKSDAAVEGSEKQTHAGKSDAAVEGSEKQTHAGDRGGAASRAGGRDRAPAGGGVEKKPRGGADATQRKKNPSAPVIGEWSTLEFFRLYDASPHNALKTVFEDNDKRFIKNGAPRHIESIPDTWLYEPRHIEIQKEKTKKFGLEDAPLTPATKVGPNMQ